MISNGKTIFKIELLKLSILNFFQATTFIIFPFLDNPNVSRNPREVSRTPNKTGYRILDPATLGKLVEAGAPVLLELGKKLFGGKRENDRKLPGNVK